mmetsp:Transcript_41595/g.73649  ORF Transcript_41595/g.73649 Transcript_41595/m.73649 type:complete len:121 (-) Transcript_41595:207-569(-)
MSITERGTTAYLKTGSSEDSASSLTSLDGGLKPLGLVPASLTDAGVPAGDCPEVFDPEGDPDADPSPVVWYGLVVASLALDETSSPALSDRSPSAEAATRDPSSAGDDDAGRCKVDKHKR